MKRIIAGVLILAWLAPSVALALGGKKALYMGGTLTSTIKEETEGILNTSNAEKMVFKPDKVASSIEIPYSTIDSFEYGQKATFRVKTAILLSPLALFAKKRRHYLSLLWKDADGKDAGVVFEVGKDSVRTTFMILEARTGKKTTFQDEDSKKNYAR